MKLKLIDAPFSPFFVGTTLASMTFSKSPKADSNSCLNKGQETTWGEIKGTRESQDSETTWNLGDHPNLVTKSTLMKHFYKTPHQILQGGDAQFFKAGTHCVRLGMAKQ